VIPEAFTQINGRPDQAHEKRLLQTHALASGFPVSA